MSKAAQQAELRAPSAFRCRLPELAAKARIYGDIMLSHWATIAVQLTPGGAAPPSTMTLSADRTKLDDYVYQPPTPEQGPIQTVP